MMTYINKKKAEKGFTLIELMIVVAIIGILAAIAIPQFAAYRVRAFNSAAESDLRNIMTSQEAAYADSQAYVAVTTTVGPGPLNQVHASLPGAKLSQNVYARVPSTSATDYTAQTLHTQGDNQYNGSAAGGITTTTKAEGSTTFQ